MENGLLTDYLKTCMDIYNENPPKGRDSFSAAKYCATLLSLTDRPLKNIAEDVGTTYGVLKVWRTEEAFKQIIANHMEGFATVFWGVGIDYYINKNKDVIDSYGVASEESFELFRELWGDIESYNKQLVKVIIDYTPNNIEPFDLLHMYSLIAEHLPENLRELVKAKEMLVLVCSWKKMVEIMEKPEICDTERRLVLSFLKTSKPDVVVRRFTGENSQARKK